MVPKFRTLRVLTTPRQPNCWAERGAPVFTNSIKHTCEFELTHI